MWRLVHVAVKVAVSGGKTLKCIEGLSLRRGLVGVPCGAAESYLTAGLLMAGGADLVGVRAVP